jgi:hypothetical protein
MSVFVDLPGALFEAQRIQLIAERVRAGVHVGFLVDDDAKAEWYLEQLRAVCAFDVEFRGVVRGAGVTDAVLLRLKGRGN